MLAADTFTSSGDRINFRSIYAYGVHTIDSPEPNIYNLNHAGRDNIGYVRPKIHGTKSKIV
jgi:hypothetical protein